MTITTTFSAQVRNLSGVATIDLHGDINSFADSELTEAYNQAESYNPSRVVLNFSDVNYINSTGIALIVGLLSRARKAHRELAVFGLTDHYKDIFQITRLSDFMNIYNDEATAIQGK
jgi:anti-anti-sigma factor